MKTWQRSVVVFAILLAAIGVASIVFWAADVYQDRKHTITANSLTPIFAGSGDDSCGRGQRIEIATAQPGSRLSVRRIRYWKDCATIDIALPNGQGGYIIPGSDVSVWPPLD